MTEPTYRQKIRTTMIDIAERVLATEGLAALQARRIAKEADCAVGTLYNVFDGLDDLIITANARTLVSLGDALIAARDAAPDATVHGRLMALALAYLDFARKNERAWRAVFEHHMTEKKDVPQWYREDQGRLFGLVESVLADSDVASADRPRAARAMFSAVHGIVTIALDQKLAPTDPEDASAHVRFIVRAISSGLGAAAHEIAR
jgi:AcrR family transcriptional regulator